MDNDLTEDLINILKESSNIYEYIQKNSFSQLSLGQYIENILRHKKISKTKLIKHSGLHRTYAYQILGDKKTPSRDKMIRLIYGLSLSLEEAQKMLKLYKFSPLYPKNKRDAIIIYGIYNHLSIIELNHLLDTIKEESIN